MLERVVGDCYHAKAEANALETNEATGVQVKDSLPTCHELQPGIAEDLPCMRQSTLKLSKLKRPTVGLVWELGEGRGGAQVSSSLDHGSKLRGPSPNSPRVAK
ncbi:hypothetical protein TNCV_1601171 [Trichonephila clavipes]|nr:hypothetical protein TNCV_1601171 [Trichonephila clavipes]